MTDQFVAIYQREGTPGWRLTSWLDANHLLGYLNPNGPSSISFTLEDGSYIQCAGAKTRLTVEARLISPRGDLHVVFGKGARTGIKEIIACSVGPITVDSSQILQMRDARKLIRHFVERQLLLDSYVAEDISARFA
jgi:hypothetical protein